MLHFPTFAKPPHMGTVRPCEQVQIYYVLCTLDKPPAVTQFTFILSAVNCYISALSVQMSDELT